MTEKGIVKLERELRRRGYEETEDSEYFCLRRWEKPFEMRGRVYHAKGRFVFTIWDYSHLGFVPDPFRYQGGAVMGVGGLIKADFDIKYASPEEVELMVQKFLDGEMQEIG